MVEICRAELVEAYNLDPSTSSARQIKNRQKASHIMNNEIIKELCNILGSENITTEKEELICHSYDATGMEFLPEAVAFPKSSSEISKIMSLATDKGFPVVARGAGSGFVGGSLPVSGGLVISMKRLNRIVEIDRDNMVAVVEPGVVTGTLQDKVADLGLFYPPDPSSLKFCTIGGNVAMGSGGPRAVKYGVTRDYVLGLEVVLPTGEIVSTGTRAAKGVVGYDLTRLLVGSEGTLAIITKVILKLIPAPVETGTLYIEFSNVLDAGRAVSAIMSAGVIPATLELIDGSVLHCIKDSLNENISSDVGAILLIDIDGSKTSVPEDSLTIEDLCTQNGATRVKRATNKRESRALWETRRSISPALFKLGTKKINEDIVVPRSKIPDLLEKLQIVSKKYKLTIASFGHAGDGNIHVNIMLNKGNLEDEAKAKKAVKEVFQIAIDLRGTISGEHGIGISKQPYLRVELSEKEIEIMEGIKRVFDPKNVLNPGKIFPE